MKELEVKIKSKRNTDINASIILSEAEHGPLLIMAHGFKADRHEGGRFTTVGRALAEVGVNSIRMGFAGCDESVEDFINFSLVSCMDDVDSCYEYMLENYDIDRERIGMIGYSHGGRVTSIYTEKHPEISVIGLWAAACENGALGKGLLGHSYDEVYKEIEEKGYYLYHNVFDDTDIKFSKEFADASLEYKPEEALRKFKGSAIVCHGTADDTVDINVSLKTINNLINARRKELVVIDKANHGFGLWDNHPEQSKQLTDRTIAFFKECL